MTLKQELEKETKAGKEEPLEPKELFHQRRDKGVRAGIYGIHGIKSMKAWAVVDTETEGGHYTPQGEPYVLFSFDNQGFPYLGIFDERHKSHAEELAHQWRRTRPSCQVVSCDIKMKVS